jgi:hypothetical protein
LPAIFPRKTLVRVDLLAVFGHLYGTQSQAERRSWPRKA